MHRREEFVSAQVHALPVDEERGRRAGRGHHAADRVIRGGVLTEALHAMPSGVEVRTCALKVGALRTAGFTRTLRTLESIATVEQIMRGGEEGRGEGGWTNGSGNVWLAEAWCSDGMVLLEGCVVSAMRIADEFGVFASWG